MNFGESSEDIDYGLIFKEKLRVLKIAYEKFKLRQDKDLIKFQEAEAYWLDDYALYMSIKKHFDLKSWYEWDEDIRLREPEAINRYKILLEDEIGFWKFLQYEFYKQWNNLKAYINNLGIEIIGDMPIYVAEDSADVWGNPEAFLLNKNTLKPLKVAGCPPDIFAATGQLWGNPIYDWCYMGKRTINGGLIA